MFVFECLEARKMRRDGVRHRRGHCAVRGRQICRELCGTVGTVCFHFPKNGKGKRGLTWAGVGVDDPSNEVCEDYRMIYCCRKTDVSLPTFPPTPPFSIKSCTKIISFSNEETHVIHTVSLPHEDGLSPPWNCGSWLRLYLSLPDLQPPDAERSLGFQKLRNFPLRDSFTCDRQGYLYN